MSGMGPHGDEALSKQPKKLSARQTTSEKKYARRADPQIKRASNTNVQRTGVQSLGRAFSIIEAVAQHRDGIGLADLSRLVGLHNSTAFHLAKTLLSLGYIRQDAETKRYRIGRKLFALAAGALDEIEMIHLANPVLENLSRTTGESGHFCVRVGDAVVVIARTSGSGAFQMADRVGVVRPAHCTALGKAILASLSPEQLRLFIQRNPLTPSTKRSITEIPEFIREIERVRQTGFAFDDGEFNLEVRCAGVAVKDFTGGVVGAVGISGPIWRLSDDSMQRHATAVAAAAQQLSKDFGYRAPEGAKLGTRLLAKSD
jgi:DNA-binding IclR family transcriptional regulator